MYVKIYGKCIGENGILTNTICMYLTTRGGIIINRKRKNNILGKILLFCILFLSYRWIFEDDRFTFGVAFWGYLALTGWVFRFGGRADQDISSESVDENPLYVYGMMRKNRKWLSGIRGCFLF